MATKKALQILLLILSSSLFLFSCKSIPQTYSPQEVAQSIIKLCREEYNLEVEVEMAGRTVWTYLALDELLDENLELNKRSEEKISQIYLNLERVILSTDRPIDFFVLAVSDIKQMGLDYITFGYCLDMKKYLFSYISRDEYFSRLVVKFDLNPEALNDKKGKHLQYFDVSLGDFLSAQIAQRIDSRFKNEKGFKLNQIGGYLDGEVFRFEFALEELTSDEKLKEFQDEFFKIAAYVLKAYEFEDFLLIELKNLKSDTKTVLSRNALKEIKSSK